MRRLERRLREAGFATINLGYPSTRLSIDRLANFVAHELRRRGDRGPFHFATHSMGGIVVRALAALPDAPAVGRVVMLAPPNAGSEIVDRLERVPFVRSALGAARRQLRTGAAGIPGRLGAPTFALGVIAGTRPGFTPLQRLVPSPSDGTVSVASTRLEGMADFLEVARAHTFLMNDAEVIAQTIAFLSTGKFRPR